MKFSENRYAVEYDSRMAREGYPGELLEIVRRQLAGLKSVIDCGAGSGFFSVPLFMDGYSVNAIEPSIAMIRIMREKIPSGGTCGALNIINKKWEDWIGSSCDALISIHSLYSMDEAESAVEKMIRSADRKIIICKDHQRESGSLAWKIRQKFMGSSDYRKIIRVDDILRKKNVIFSVMDLDQERRAPYEDPEAEADYYCYHLNLDRKYRNRVMDLLLKESVREGDHYAVVSRYYDQIFIF
jgi:hypothetical protein